MPQLAAFPKCFLNDIIVHKSMTIFDWIELASQTRIDGLEMYFPFFEGKDEAFLESVRNACVEKGLSIPMMCFSPDFTHPDRAIRLIALESQKRAIDLTVNLGGKYCRTLSGQNRPGLDRKMGIRWCVEMIRQAVDYAAERDVILNIENHYKDGYWSYPEFALQVDVFLEIVEQIDSPFFGINYDPSNAIIAGEDPLKLLHRIADRVVTMHASDRYLKGGTLDDLRLAEKDPLHGYVNFLHHGVIGEGLIDYDAIFKTLKDSGFDGWISIEDGLNGMDELRKSADFLKEKISQHFLA